MDFSNMIELIFIFYYSINYVPQFGANLQHKINAVSERNKIFYCISAHKTILMSVCVIKQHQLMFISKLHNSNTVKFQNFTSQLRFAFYLSFYICSLHLF